MTVPGKGITRLAAPAKSDLNRGRTWKDLPAAWRFGLAILPVGLQLGSFVPLFFFAEALARALDIPWNAPVRSHPRGLFWFVPSMGEMLLLQLSGVLLGFSLNGLILRFGLKWTWREIQEAGACPRALARWLCERMTGTKGAGPHTAEEHLLYDDQLDEAM